MCEHTHASAAYTCYYAYVLLFLRVFTLSVGAGAPVLAPGVEAGAMEVDEDNAQARQQALALAEATRAAEEVSVYTCSCLLIQTCSSLVSFALHLYVQHASA